ncbi:MAG: tetratricopeptide repeat protein [Verrucomicrobiia bacterium]
MIRFVCLLLLFAARLARADAAADKLTAAGVVEFTAAYQAWDGARFGVAVNLFQQACTPATATATNYYWLGTAEFHRMLQLLGLPESQANKHAAKDALDAAVVALTQAVKLDGSHAESHALLGTLYGMKISENMLRAVWLGPHVQQEFKLALTNGTNDPRVQYLLGMSQFYTARRTASRHEALATLLTAEKLFEAEARTPAAPLEPRWGHDSCLTFIGSSYEKLGQRTEAENYFRKALALHPQDSLAQAGLKRVTKNEK